MHSANRSIDKSKNARMGFTIVELLMVIGIIAVLIGITVSAVSGSLQRARGQKARAICMLVEQGIATYYAQKGEWPVEALNGDGVEPNADANGNKEDTSNNKVLYVLEAKEVREAVRKVLKEAGDGNPMMDASGLFVSTSPGEKDSKKRGMDFMDAVLGTKRDPSGIRLENMYFGYPESDHGYFRRFKMYYTPATDKLTVTQQ